MSMLGRLVFSPNLRKCICLSRGNALRCISTSKKNSDTTTIENPTSTACEPQASTAAQTKNWISYGFSNTDKQDDTNQMNALFFFGISVTFVLGGVLLAYRPDELLRDWSQREAFLELRRRENAGLPLIDPNYIPLESVNLPSDEELGDTEIII